MAKLLTDSTALKVQGLINTKPVPQTRTAPDPRDLWINRTASFPPYDPGDDPAGTLPGSPIDPPASPTDTDYYLKLFSFECWANAGLETLKMEPGDIYLGPLTFILWADIDGATTAPEVSATDTHVWLEVRVNTGTTTGSIGTGYAWMVYGPKTDMLAALDAAEQENKVVVPLVETVWSDGRITKVKNLQCGDAKIFRSAV